MFEPQLHSAGFRLQSALAKSLLGRSAEPTIGGCDTWEDPEWPLRTLRDSVSTLMPDFFRTAQLHLSDDLGFAWRDVIGGWRSYQP